MKVLNLATAIVAFLVSTASSAPLLQDPDRKTAILPPNRLIDRESPKDVDRDFALVGHFGDSILTILVWDGEKWERRAIAPQATTIIGCSKCSDEIPISFDDGTKQTQQIKLKKGSAYGFYWGIGRWEIDFYNTVRDHIRYKAGIYYRT